MAFAKERIPKDDEHPKERLNRKLEQLLQELRVVLPGVDVLFGFLLILPFTEKFGDVTESQRAVYFVAFVAAGLASALLIAPSAYHRLRWRYLVEKEEPEEKAHMIVTASRLATAGIAFLGLAIGAAVFLVSDVVVGVRLAGVLTGAIAAAFVWFWFGLPLLHRVRDVPK